MLPAIVDVFDQRIQLLLNHCADAFIEEGVNGFAAVPPDEERHEDDGSEWPSTADEEQRKKNAAGKRDDANAEKELAVRAVQRVSGGRVGVAGRTGCDRPGPFAAAPGGRLHLGISNLHL